MNLNLVSLGSLNTYNFVKIVPPKWIVEPEDKSVILGNSVLIPCEAAGSPPPTLLWKQAIGKTAT